MDASDALKWIENEIEILKNMEKHENVISYLDSFISIVDEEYKIYHIVTNFYEVFSIYYQYNKQSAII
jgi:serine/threonine protein kinase